MIVKIVLLITSILFIILSSLSLDTYNKLDKVNKDQVESLCGVQSDSVKNGKTFSIVMLVASILVFVLIVGEYVYKKAPYSNKMNMRFAF